GRAEKGGSLRELQGREVCRPESKESPGGGRHRLDAELVIHPLKPIAKVDDVVGCGAIRVQEVSRPREQSGGSEEEGLHVSLLTQGPHAVERTDGRQNAHRRRVFGIPEARKQAFVDGLLEQGGGATGIFSLYAKAARL